MQGSESALDRAVEASMAMRASILCAAAFAATIGNDSHRGAVRESFHSQMLRPPNITKASMLGQSGIWCPATSTSGCITKRNNCAKLNSPKMTLATRNPRICEFMFVSFRLFVFESMRSSANDRRPDPTACRSRRPVAPSGPLSILGSLERLSSVKSV